MIDCMCMCSSIDVNMYMCIYVCIYMFVYISNIKHYTLSLMIFNQWASSCVVAGNIAFITTCIERRTKDEGALQDAPGWPQDWSPGSHMSVEWSIRWTIWWSIHDGKGHEIVNFQLWKMTIIRRNEWLNEGRHC